MIGMRTVRGLHKSAAVVICGQVSAWVRARLRRMGNARMA